MCVCVNVCVYIYINTTLFLLARPPLPDTPLPAPFVSLFCCSRADEEALLPVQGLQAPYVAPQPALPLQRVLQVQRRRCRHTAPPAL